MIVCPVCEHPKAIGAECEVCGARLARGDAGAPPVPAIDGLEPTAHAAASGPTGRLAELEPTGYGAVPYVPDPTPGLDPGREAPVDVDAAPALDVERTAAEIPGDAPTALPAFAICRYCRTPAMPGERICARCGMRLPLVDAAAPEAAPEPSLCSCGTPVRGASCPSCGARLR